MMEVASPLTLGPSSAGNKRSLACSPQQSMLADEMEERVTKRRRFHGAADMDSLSEDFSSHSLFYKNLPPSNKSIFATNGACTSLKRVRTMEAASSPGVKQEELNRVIQEQACLIESLKSDKSGLEQSLATLKPDHERVTKDNQILRKAVAIQEERRVNLDVEVKSVKAQADERIRGLEQIILTLRFHLQAQQNVGNDFMHQRPPDVY